MVPNADRQSQLDAVLSNLPLPPGVRIRVWTEADFPAIQRLSNAEGWPTPETRPEEALRARQHAWPTLVVVDGEQVIGFVRALTEKHVTTYIAEVLVASHWRGKGVGTALLEACHRLYPATRLDLLSTAAADRFYEALSFRRFPGFRKSYCY